MSSTFVNGGVKLGAAAVVGRGILSEIVVRRGTYSDVVVDIICSSSATAGDNVSLSTSGTLFN